MNLIIPMIPTTEIVSQDAADLRRAVEQLESPGFFIKIVNWVGQGVENGIKQLPEKAQQVIGETTKRALGLALDAATKTMDLGIQSPASNIWHKVVVGATGAAGGALGLAGMSVELPISTGIMLRSIADIGRAEGEDLHLAEARLQCIAVFGMGGRSTEDNSAESAYYAARVALGEVVSEAAAYVAKSAANKATEEAVPVLVRLIARVTERFTPQVAEKAMAMGIPIIGAVGGATINLLFIDHFQTIAHGHFTVRRLERKYGREVVESLYEKLAKELKDHTTN